MALTVSEILAQLSPEDETILFSLPYRAGLYVSFSDVTGGWEAQDKEIQSLTAILRQFSEDFFKTEFTQKVLMETLAARIDWLAWSRGINNLPNEVEKMMSVLSPMMEAEDLQSFCDVILDIALVVAMAFREKEDQTEASPEQVGAIRQLIVRIIGGKKGGDPLSHVNISDAEKQAVLTLANSLGYEGF